MKTKTNTKRQAIDLIVFACIMVVSAFAIPARSQLITFKPQSTPFSLDSLTNVSPYVFLRHGDMNMQGKDYNMAVLYYKKVLSSSPDDSDIYYNLGVAFNELKDEKGAIKTYKEGLGVNDKDSGMHYNLGVTFGDMGRWDMAVREYRKAIKFNPMHTKAFFNLGIAYGNLEKWGNAMNIYRKLAKMNPIDQEAHYNLAMVGIILNDRKSITKEYKTLQRIAPDLASRVKEIMQSGGAAS